MYNFLNTALENVRSRPAPYTIMIVVIAVGAYMKNDITEPEYQIIAMALIFITVIISLFLIIKNPDDTSDSVNKTVENHLSKSIKKIETACVTVCVGKADNHPLLQMIDGFMTQLSFEIAQDSIEIPPKYYTSCLNKLHDVNIVAIADLCADLESWDSNKSTMWKNVKERIFHLKWEDMYSNKLGDLVKTLEAEKSNILSENCEIKFITSRETEKVIQEHPLQLKSEIGKHLLIIGRSLVGGYIKTTDGDKLYLEASKGTVIEEAEAYFNKFKENAIPFSMGMTAADIRAAWVNKFHIGLWDPNWNGKQERDDRYVQEYDHHIHCWVPDYKMVLDECHSVLKRELEMACRESNKAIKVVEIGCGTGVLTKEIAKTILNIDRALSKSITSYTIVDQSNQMIEITKERIQNEFGNKLDSVLKYIQLKFTPSTDNKNDTRYNVIVGSLIFHFLTTKEWDRNAIKELFEQFKKDWLTDDGCIIFADIFFSQDKSTLEKEYWLDHMKNQGMSQDAIELFNENNLDMFNSPRIEELESILGECELRMVLYETAAYRNPFNIIKIVKLST